MVRSRLNPNGSPRSSPVAAEEDAGGGDGPLGRVIVLTPLTTRRPRSIPTRVGISTGKSTTRVSNTVHPHARGDFVKLPQPMPALFGPSPRAWGFRSRRAPRNGSFRSIPTRVGISSTASVCPMAPTVHPHARGDFLKGGSDGGAHLGPSPRAWGFLGDLRLVGAQGRSIPTRVGISIPVMRLRVSTSVHPHARGDFRPAHRRPGRPAGPSPRAWGFHLRAGRK